MENIITSPKGRCTFPSAELRSYRGELLREVSEIEAGSRNGLDWRLRIYADVFMSIDRLRCDHEELSGCRCWYLPGEPAEMPEIAGTIR